MRLLQRVFLVGCAIAFATGWSVEASTAIPETEFVEIVLETEAKIEHPSNESVRRTVRIYYRVNQTEIEKDYMDNASALDVIDRVFVSNLLDNEVFIVITGRASPEGSSNNNQRLSKERALSLKNYIKQKSPEIKDDQLIIIPGGEDWDGLLKMVENDKNVPGRNQLLWALKSNLSREAQKEEMKAIENGKTYAYLLKHILPYLRGNVTGTIYSKKGEQIVVETVRTDTVEVLRVDTVFVEREIIYIDTVYHKEVLQKPKRPFVMAVKNNLIYDAVLLPNLSIEIPFGRNYRWSAGIEGNWSWWNTNADDYHYHRIQIAGAELRRWFGNKTGNPLNGWFVGTYGYGGTYDLRLFTDEKSDEGQLSNWTYSGGLTFGYAMPIAERFNLEFGLGVGYLGGKYHKYSIGDCEECLFPWRSTHQRKYIGLTKANISLVWLIGNITNKNKGKEKQP